ncbi:GntR family transcriptional regulator [Aestuariispira ectoiniformans]|uniref:GntR family transcriptional regulator n=1 Tax=Aestuariispira ectoiniformans TaxID=2775080 RepID=UPI00223B02D5|nr:GntR family transcriptional regulator [Aestuariispira ectoiniformans]
MNSLDPVLETLRQEANLKGASASPLYRRLKNGIRKAIEQGVLSPDDALPPERDLAQKLEVSRVTVRKAVGSLVEEGLLVQRQGAGTFVAPRVEQPLSKLTGFTEDMEARGLSPSVEWLDRSLGSATPDEAIALNLSPGAEVARLYRIRFADDKPMCLEQAILPASALPHPEQVDSSLYAVLERSHMRPTRALQHLRAQLFEYEQARLLNVQPGTACLYIERRSFLPNGQPVEFVRSYYRGDSYDFVAELQL